MHLTLCDRRKNVVQRNTCARPQNEEVLLQRIATFRPDKVTLSNVPGCCFNYKSNGSDHLRSSCYFAHSAAKRS